MDKRAREKSLINALIRISVLLPSNETPNSFWGINNQIFILSEKKRNYLWVLKTKQSAED